MPKRVLAQYSEVTQVYVTAYVLGDREVCAARRKHSQTSPVDISQACTLPYFLNNL